MSGFAEFWGKVTTETDLFGGGKGRVMFCFQEKKGGYINNLCRSVERRRSTLSARKKGGNSIPAAGDLLNSNGGKGVMVGSWEGGKESVAFRGRPMILFYV